MHAPVRPDYKEAMNAMARAKGLSGTPNQWVIDSLTDRDVIVIDMFDKVYKGTFSGRQPDYRHPSEDRQRRRGDLGRHPGHRADAPGAGRAGVLSWH